MKSKKEMVVSPAAAAKAPYAKRAEPLREPIHEEVSARARADWEKAGRPEGQDLAIWLEAERQLRLEVDLPDADDDARADTRRMLGEDSGTFDERLEEIGEQGGNRSATSL